MGGTAFTAQEIAYLREHPVARVATLGEGEQPDVVPVVCELDGEAFWFGGGETVLRTRKVRNVRAGRRRVAIVFDDVPTLEPFAARGIRVYGVAEDPVERTGMIGPGWYVRVRPMESWSWNLDGEPAGDAWYPVSHTVHA
ncbi:PPOX class F420-dependent oxidoreductase [Cellulomonas fimi]|uniref:PPOX class F420-dependent oxidoreductase n=1 Tax=Cellulomonas fimi TaxID=1708 RepID=UPI0023594C6E|nr:PPOX class F420-dependent oxidoreductase [Cellulomonas fimi]